LPVEGGFDENMVSIFALVCLSIAGMSAAQAAAPVASAATAAVPRGLYAKYAERQTDAALSGAKGIVDPAMLALLKRDQDKVGRRGRRDGFRSCMPLQDWNVLKVTSYTSRVRQRRSFGRCRDIG
jgi:opacity protein-like surface antigen